jgi:endonuclease YncB( thermonuclease family)
MGLCFSASSLSVPTSFILTPVPFTLRDEFAIATPLSCYDGDTCTLGFQLHHLVTGEPVLYSIKCRLACIDTPEMKGGTQETKELAVMARNFLINQMCTTAVPLSQTLTRQHILQHLKEHGKIVSVCCGDFDKYGRLLVTLYPSGTTKESASKVESINMRLVTQGYAKLYDGGTKQEW